jgi:hypothetical protein
MQTRLQETINHLRADIEKVDEPQLKPCSRPEPKFWVALRRPSETTKRKNESAWRK